MLKEYKNCISHSVILYRMTNNPSCLRLLNISLDIYRLETRPKDLSL